MLWVRCRVFRLGGLQHFPAIPTFLLMSHLKSLLPFSSKLPWCSLFSQASQAGPLPGLSGLSQIPLLVFKSHWEGPYYAPQIKKQPNTHIFQGLGFCEWGLHASS